MATLLSMAPLGAASGAPTTDGIRLVQSATAADEFSSSRVAVREGAALLLRPRITGGVDWRWFKNGQALEGPGEAGISIAKTRPSDAGVYVAEATVEDRTVRVATFVAITNPAWDLLTFGTAPTYLRPLKRPRGSLGTLSGRPLTADGRILVSGQGGLTAVEGVSGVVQVHGNHALLADGSVVRWRTMPWENPEDVVILDAARSGVIAIASQVALRADGTRVAIDRWGEGTDLEAVPLSSFFPHPSASGASGTDQIVQELSEMFWGLGSKLTLRDDGSLACIGQLAEELPALDGLRGVVAIQPGLMLIRSSPPRITRHPRNQTLLADEAIRLEVGTGEGVVAYQWYRNGEAIDGATDSAYQTWGAPGVYTVKVSNSLGSVTSRPARIVLAIPNPFPANLITDFTDGVDFAGYVQPGLGRPFVRGLPPGLEFDVETGAISGRISRVGVYTISYGYKSGSDVAWSKTVKLVVSVSFAGRLEGLLGSSERNTLDGKVVLTTAPGGRFTGTLVTAADRKPIAFRGALKRGEPTDVALPGGRTLRLSIARSGDESLARLLTGAGEDQTEVAAGGLRAISLPTGIETTLRYTATLSEPNPSEEGDARAFPPGASRATATLSPKGTLVLRGRLAEGTLMTASLSPGTLLEYSWFTKLHGPGGHVGGLLAFTDQEAPAGGGPTEAGASIRWAKPASESPRAAAYPLGFSLDTRLRMERWELPAKKPVTITLADRLGLVEGDTFELTLSGDPSSPFTVTLPTLRFEPSKNAFVPVEPATEQPPLLLKIDAKTGRVSGLASFAWAPGRNATDRRTWTLDGVAFQPSSDDPALIAEGFLLPPGKRASQAEGSGALRLVLRPAIE